MLTVFEWKFSDSKVPSLSSRRSSNLDNHRRTFEVKPYEKLANEGPFLVLVESNNFSI